MEARSLASLNQLAANPPSYPVNPTAQPLEPIVLYIARVPGTRDVILSPFKPQLKNVTSEDVASSLYYVHMEMHSDGPTPKARATSPDDLPRTSEDSSSSMAIRRKPLPPSARSLTPESPPREEPPVPAPMPAKAPLPTQEPPRIDPPFDAPPPYEEFHEQTHQLPRRRPVSFHSLGNDVTPLANTRSHGSEMLEPGNAHPSGPYSLQPPNNGLEGNRPRAHSQSQGVFVRDFAPPLPPRPSTTDTWNQESKSPTKPAGTPFTLTLIRRDPSTGHQWNVGQISSHQLFTDAGPGEPNSYFPARPPSPGYSQTTAQPPIDIRIETSGYAKFRNMPSARGMDGTMDSLFRAAGQMRQTDGGMFARQVNMMYTKSFATNFREKVKETRERHRSQSVSAVSAFTPAQPTEPDYSIGQPMPGMKPRGYVFQSPWDSRCEFRTGNAGRSLRCHHHVHESASFNPLVSEQAEGSNNNQSKPSSVVSELRFNLPSSELFTSDHDREFEKTHRLGNFGKFFRQNTDEDDDDGVVSPFDMNLGRERAGGGNRGKRAKLGKLIIYNDGLKMLDLLVASNVGVWWMSWEKSF